MPPLPNRRGVFGRGMGRQGRFPGRYWQRPVREMENQRAIEFLSSLSEATAGRFYQSKVSDLKKTFSEIADELRNQYELGFYPDSAMVDRNPHALKVSVARQDVAVRARRTYRPSKRS